jgi:sporulation integral membrane protein YtvI
MRHSEGCQVTRELKLLIILLLLGVGLILGLKFFFPLVAPFLLGLVIAGLIEPMVQKLELRFKVSRGLAVGLVLFSFIMMSLSLSGLILLSSFKEAQRILPEIPLLLNRLSDLGSGLINRLFRFMNLDFTHFSLKTGPLSRIFDSFIHWVLGLLPRFPEMVLAIVLGGIAAYFFSRDKQLFSQIFYRCLPRDWRNMTVQIKDEIIVKIGRFFRAELTLCLITAALTALFFRILRIPGVFAYGLLTGLLDLIPVIGPGLVFIPLALAQFVMGDYYQGIGIIGSYCLILLVRQITEVKLIGDNFDLHPLVTIIIIYIGLKIFGFSGIFFGPILIITLRAIYRALATRFVAQSRAPAKGRA